MVAAHDALPLVSRSPILALSSDGKRMLAVAGAMLCDTDAPLRSAADVVAVGLLEGAAWVVTTNSAGHALERFDHAGRLVGTTPLGDLGRAVRMTVARSGSRLALIEGDHAAFVRESGDGSIVLDIRRACGADHCVMFGGWGVAERRGGNLVIGRKVLALPSDLAAARVVGGGLVFDGSTALVELDLHGKRTAITYDLRGAMKARIRLGEVAVLAIAERMGLLVLGRDSHVALFDLRANRCVGERILPAAARACAIDSNGTRIVISDADQRVHHLSSSLRDGDAWIVDEEREAESENDAEIATETDTNTATENAIRAEAEAEPEAETVAEAETVTATDAVQTVTDAASAHLRDDARTEPASPARAATTTQPTAPAVRDAWPDTPLLALSPSDAPRIDGPLEDYVAAVRAWVIATCRTALAVAQDSGRIGGSPLDLDALVGAAQGRATAALDRARSEEADATTRFARWNLRGSPHVELGRELALSQRATLLLVLVAAPQIWGELARAYGACSVDPARPLVDELLLAHLLEADTATRSEIGRELDDDAPLIASGAVIVGRGVRPYASLTVHPAIARRLHGAAPASDVAPPEPLDLARFLGPRDEVRALLATLAQPTTSPPRIVLRGRAGFGRRSLASAIAARSGRGLGVIDIDATSAEFEVRLRERLCDVALRGDLPCVSLDGLVEDPAIHARIRRVLDRHPGALFVRAPSTGELPLSPGYHAVELGALDETERRAAWTTMLHEARLDPAPAAAIATRFAVGPGAMQRACASAARASEPLDRALVSALRQHRSARIAALAGKVEHLAARSEVILPDEIEVALDELIARVHHRRTVLEDWGLRTVATSAFGITALFQGGPGTGKSMAAQAVARELGFELWRVDVSKVVSKWIGETEKNLAALFDAAEDGEIVLLFDEADSLFGKRTSVKSSNDRNANLETNYLLQRLDTFTGVAILTTNFGTAIDPAFRRRLSVQAQFPFPDEVDRERLWRAHLPASMPVADDLDLADLARRFPLTGGYIRNAVLRAAYLAAARGTPVSAIDLERSVRAEYAAHGKVTATGAIA